MYTLSITDYLPFVIIIENYMQDRAHWTYNDPEYWKVRFVQVVDYGDHELEAIDCSELINSLTQLN